MNEQKQTGKRIVSKGKYVQTMIERTSFMVGGAASESGNKRRCLCQDRLKLRQVITIRIDERFRLIKFVQIDCLA